MARPSKTVIEQRKQATVRVDRAKAAIMEQFSRLLTKHLPALIRPGVDSAGQLNITIREGRAGLDFRYQTTVQDAATVVLDDGQEDLPLDSVQTGQGEAAASGAEHPGSTPIQPPDTH